ncbi:Twin-arginine translocation pathway signal [Vibrio splendidus]|uniref:DUF6931 family protein n=1 Tax=Vibrio splendidus TaxID=29497 RepID=UPI000C8264FB|nr:Twin-arginine translocation pathway signal [Vibrio splendidus]PMM18934.1 Twin-arginine translocation pathway signal [Vibrio splendidus]PMN20312.1 Twin-arginine translocation pathway signal [Vibrio splendidus]
MTLIKIPHDDVQEIFRAYEPSPEILELATAPIAPAKLIAEATHRALFSDAIMFIAHALPIRESVWWAVCCADTRMDWNEDETNAVRAARAWVHTPDETSRRFAEQMIDKAGLDTGAGWVAQAAFWSGGSMIKPEDPVVPPPPYLYAQAVAGSVNLCAVLPDGEHAQSRYHEFIDMGLNIASGGNGKR